MNNHVNTHGSKQAGSDCPMCGHQLSVSIVSENLPLRTPGGVVTLAVQVPYEKCSECSYEGFGEAGERARTEAVYRHVGRLTPWEIVSIREGLGLNQVDFASLLGVGRASLERWERGATMQNQSMDNLLLLLSNPGHKSWLDSERRKRLREETVGSVVIVLDRFRALKPADEDRLVGLARSFKLR